MAVSMCLISAKIMRRTTKRLLHCIAGWLPKDLASKSLKTPNFCTFTLYVHMSASALGSRLYNTFSLSLSVSILHTHKQAHTFSLALHNMQFHGLAEKSPQNKHCVKTSFPPQKCICLFMCLKYLTPHATM